MSKTDEGGRMMATKKPPRVRHKTGFHLAARALAKHGINALDGRSKESRALRTWRTAIIKDLGGDDLSAMQRMLVELATRHAALLSIADEWLQAHPEDVVNHAEHAFAPLVLQRLQVADRLVDTLKALGLEKKARAIETLASILASPPQTRPSAKEATS